MDKTVVVVGAGIAGLTAAHYLKQAGLRPLVLEAGSWVGGRMSSEQVRGFILDRGSYTFPQFHVNLRAFLADYGLSDALQLTSGDTSTFLAGTEHRIKIGSVRDFLKYRLLSAREKRALIKLYLQARALGKALNLVNPTARSFALEDQTVAGFLLERYGKGLLEKVGYPITSETFLGLPETNSRLAFLATLDNLAHFRIFAFNQGMGQLPQRMAEALDIRLDTPVTAVSRVNPTGAWQVESGGARAETLSADGVVFAAPPPVAARVMPGLPAETAAALATVRYAPSIAVALALEGEAGPTALVNNLLRTEFSTLATLVSDRAKGPGRVPPGKDLITALLSPPASAELLDRPQEEIISRVLAEAETLLPGLSGRVLFTRVYRWPHGAVQLPPGAVRAAAHMRRLLEALPSTLAFAGDGLYKSSLETAFNTGVAAAHRIIRSLA